MRFFSPLPGRRKTAYGLSATWAISLLHSAFAAEQAAADFFVHSLPGAPDGPLLKMHAG